MREGLQLILFRSFVRVICGIAVLVGSVVFVGMLSGRQATASDPGASLLAWGDGSNGQLGNSTTTNAQTSPVSVSLPNGISPTAFAASSTAYAIGSNGALYAWGEGGNGQLGNGMGPQIQTTPVEVDLPSGVSATSVATGSGTLAIGSNGKLYAFGEGYALGYQAGSFEPNMSFTPIVIRLPKGVTATAIAVGSESAYAIGSNDTLYGWGIGDIGDGSIGDSSTPVPVDFPPGVTARTVVSNNNATYAIGSNGSLYAWGDQYLGNGTKDASTTPILVSLPQGATPTAIAAGANIALAVGSNDRLYAWGSGYLGNGTDSSSLTPVRVSLPSGVAATAISAGFNNGYALGSNGALYVWGTNFLGELGSTSPTAATTPVPVDLPAGTTPAALGAEPDADTSYVIVSVSPPTISSISPMSGPPGSRVKIYGASLGNASEVTIGDAQATIISDTESAIKIDVPANAATGKIKVVTPTGKVKSATSFSVT